MSTYRIVLLAVLLALPAAAWGPKTQVAIVSTGAQLLSKDGTVGLDRTIKDLSRGASMPMDQLRSVYPELDTNPMNAIEQEMQLLSGVRGERVDPYFAFRLGTLGKVVAEVTAPLQTANPAYRNLYFSEVDKIISTLSLAPGERKTVEVRAYFERVLAEAAVNDAVIQREYESGAGFSEVARSTVAKDASRCVNAVADVFFTIATGRAAAGGVSDSQRQRYVVSAYEYYIRRGNEMEIDAMVKHLDSVVAKTPQMREQIGDMFKAAGMDERAMAEYGVVLSEAPEQRDVVGKMAAHYVEQGKEALAEERYESAIESFQRALEADPLHPEAERFRLEAESGLEAREARLAASREALQRASDLMALAEEEAMRTRHAEAIELLRQAQFAYAEAGDEFPSEAQERMRGEERARNRIREYKLELTANARVFSGSGYATDIRHLAETGAVALDERALKAIIENEYKAQLGQLESQLSILTPGS